MIAFAYAQTGPRMAALYLTLAEGLVANLKAICPNESVLMLTDEQTPIVKGVNSVLRVERTMPLMTWRLKAHQLAHSMADEILFVEPDVRLVEDVMHVFQEPFDIAVTTREEKARLQDEDRDTPYTLGMTFSRSDQFWREAKMVCQSLSERDQTWFGDMLAVDVVVKSGKFDVKPLDGAIYNHVVNDPAETVTAKALHYKGKRKMFLFPQVEEAA